MQADHWVLTLTLEDVGISGATTNRPGFQRLRQAVIAHEIDVIVVYHTDRISRDVSDFLNFLELLKKHSVRLVSVTQKLDFTGAIGEFNTIVQAAMQQFERKRTVERTRDTMMEHARKGIFNGGHPPLGYKVASNALVVVEAEAAVVVRIFAAVADNVPLQQIADALNRDGHRTKIRFCKKKVHNSKVRITVQRGGLKFRTDHLELIIRNPTYKGYVRWGSEVNKGNHQAIIDPELRDRSNRAIAKIPEAQIRLARVQDRFHHLLKGVLFCGHCGVSLIPHWSGKKDPSGHPFRYYECLRHYREGRQADSCAGRLPVAKIDGVVLSALAQLGQRPELVQATLAAARSGGRAEGQRLRQCLRLLDARLKETNAQITALISAIKDGKVRSLTEALQAEADALAREKQQLEREREPLAQQAARWRNLNPEPAVITEALRDFEGLVLRLPPPKRKELVQNLVERIEIRADKSEVAAASERKFSMQLWCHLSAVDLSATLQTPKDSRLRIKVGFSLRREGKGTVAMLAAPFSSVVPQTATITDDRAPRHAIHDTVRWQRLLEAEYALCPADIARREQCSRAHVSYRLQLGSLAPEIKSFLLELRDSKSIRFFGRTRLLRLANLPLEAQLQAFEKQRSGLIRVRHKTRQAPRKLVA
jgi:DNA invertase Pin-like site-specific DNA recombinase